MQTHEPVIAPPKKKVSAKPVEQHKAKKTQNKQGETHDPYTLASLPLFTPECDSKDFIHSDAWVPGAPDTMCQRCSKPGKGGTIQKSQKDFEATNLSDYFAGVKPLNNPEYTQYGNFLGTATGANVLTINEKGGFYWVTRYNCEEYEKKPYPDKGYEYIEYNNHQITYGPDLQTIIKVGSGSSVTYEFTQGDIRTKYTLSEGIYLLASLYDAHYEVETMIRNAKHYAEAYRREDFEEKKAVFDLSLAIADFIVSALGLKVVGLVIDIITLGSALAGLCMETSGDEYKKIIKNLDLIVGFKNGIIRTNLFEKGKNLQDFLSENPENTKDREDSTVKTDAPAESETSETSVESESSEEYKQINQKAVRSSLTIGTACRLYSTGYSGNSVFCIRKDSFYESVEHLSNKKDLKYFENDNLIYCTVKDIQSDYYFNDTLYIGSGSSVDVSMYNAWDGETKSYKITEGSYSIASLLILDLTNRIMQDTKIRIQYARNLEKLEEIKAILDLCNAGLAVSNFKINSDSLREGTEQYSKGMFTYNNMDKDTSSQEYKDIVENLEELVAVQKKLLAFNNLAGGLAFSEKLAQLRELGVL